MSGTIYSYNKNFPNLYNMNPIPINQTPTRVPMEDDLLYSVVLLGHQDSAPIDATSHLLYI